MLEKSLEMKRFSVAMYGTAVGSSSDICFVVSFFVAAAEGAALAPLVAEMLNVLGDNDFGSSFSPLFNRVLVAGEALKASNDKTPELTKALEKMETRREKDARDVNKSLFMSTPPGQIKLTFDVRGLRLWYSMMQVAHDAFRRRKDHKRKASVLASRMELVKGRLNVLECLARQDALTKVAAVRSSTASTKTQVFPGCANTVALLRHKRLLENTYETCQKEDASPAVKSKKRPGLGFKGKKEATPASDSASASAAGSSHSESESAAAAAHQEAPSHEAQKGLGSRPLGSAEGSRASADFLSRSSSLTLPGSRGHFARAADHDRGRSQTKKTKEEREEERRKKKEEKKARKEKAAQRKAQAALAHAAKKDGSATRKQRKAQARLLKKASQPKGDTGTHVEHGTPEEKAKQQEPGTYAHQTHREGKDHEHGKHGEGKHHEHDKQAEGKHHEHDKHAEGKHHEHGKHAEGKHAEGTHHEHDKHAEGKHHEHGKHAEGKHHEHDKHAEGEHAEGKHHEHGKHAEGKHAEGTHHEHGKHAEGKHDEHGKHGGGKSPAGHKESEGSASASSTSAVQLFDRSSPLLRHQRWERGIESHF
uniref:Putative transmembrane protein n=1 Tax=Toxoplasma gondii TgCATBr9 TaxID=943120 RepID=A0A2T6J103_TOXGO|nr:putative transmembrane protein [Toxoplasma gondii TgCATBr9]